MDGEYDFIVQACIDLPELLRSAYTMYGSILLVAAPILTFSNVFYFFKNFYFLNDYDIAVISKKDIEFYDSTLNKIT